MSSQSKRSLAFIYESWRQEDRCLKACINEVRAWMREVNQLGIPHFGETATRLRPLRIKLFTHFGRENELISQLAHFYPDTSPEIDGVRKSSIADHDRLLARLEDLIDRLSEPDPPFQSWTEAMDEVGLFVDAVEQHELQESGSIDRLLPELNGD